MALDTRTSLLRQAELLIRTRGYSAFSYADLAERVGIRKASIHHHFATKEELGCVLITDYQQRFELEIADIERKNKSPLKRLQIFGSLFLDSSEKFLLPFCFAMAAERSTLPESLHGPVRNLFDYQLRWVTEVVEAGVVSGDFRPVQSAKEISAVIISSLEGGSVLGWAQQDNGPVLIAFNYILQTIVK